MSKFTIIDNYGRVNTLKLKNYTEGIEVVKKHPHHKEIGE
jgi:hypothetical protein